MAQSVERRLGKAEATGPIPASSRGEKPEKPDDCRFFGFFYIPEWDRGIKTVFYGQPELFRDVFFLKCIFSQKMSFSCAEVRDC